MTFLENSGQLVLLLSEVAVFFLIEVQLQIVIVQVVSDGCRWALEIQDFLILEYYWALVMHKAIADVGCDFDAIL